eukprot:scaffold55721_cov51-Phaeocystis_antarctica.AAC.1
MPDSAPGPDPGSDSGPGPDPAPDPAPLPDRAACLPATSLVDRADGVPGRVWYLHRERPSGGRVRRPAALAQAWRAPAARAAAGRREQ